MVSKLREGDPAWSTAVNLDAAIAEAMRKDLIRIRASGGCEPFDATSIRTHSKLLFYSDAFLHPILIRCFSRTLFMLKEFCACQSGTVAVEFSMVSALMTALLLAVLEKTTMQAGLSRLLGVEIALLRSKLLATLH